MYKYLSWTLSPMYVTLTNKSTYYNISIFQCGTKWLTHWLSQRKAKAPSARQRPQNKGKKKEERRERGGKWLRQRPPTQCKTKTPVQGKVLPCKAKAPSRHGKSSKMSTSRLFGNENVHTLPKISTLYARFPNTLIMVLCGMR